MAFSVMSGGQQESLFFCGGCVLVCVFVCFEVKGESIIRNLVSVLLNLRQLLDFQVMIK